MINVNGVPRYTTRELKRMPRRAQGQADDLRYDKGGIRIWLSRCGVEDGEPYENTATVELFNPNSGKWETRYQYDADHPTTILESL